jgi:aspartate 1-decarboxylase
MLITICKSKIHRVKVTEANLDYEGSITIDVDILKKADILPYEKVQVVNNNNGARFETYVIPGKRGSGIICLNGAAARLGEVGDILIIISYCELEKEEASKYKPKIVLVDKKNKPIK